MMATTPPRILIADDQPDVLNALRLLLKGQGYETEGVTSPAELLRAVAASEFDLLLMDLNYARDTNSGREGLDLLCHLKETDDAPAIVVMTGWATVDWRSKPYNTAWPILWKALTNARLGILQSRSPWARARASRRRAAQIRTGILRCSFTSGSGKLRRRDLFSRGFAGSIPQLAGCEILRRVAAYQRSAETTMTSCLRRSDAGLCIADVAGRVCRGLLMSICRPPRSLAAPSLPPAACARG
jgi:CheY-like chemotaxis protein